MTPETAAYAPNVLVGSRGRPAALLYELWKGPVNAAGALLWARMAEALEDVRNLPQTHRE